MRRALRLLAIAVAAVACAPATASAQSATTCPATFQVLHNDRIGALKLPAGAYQITATGLSCAQASKLFTQFLNDWDGNLPSPWRVVASRSQFVRGTSGTSFTVRRVTTPATPGACSGTFAIFEPVNAAGLQIGLGHWALSVAGGLSCSTAFQVFAQTADTNLVPPGWTVDPATNTFRRGGQSFVATNQGNAPSGIGRSTGTRCPATFRVLNNDRIGALSLPKGNYLITLLPGGGLSCPVASDLFAAFLRDTNGRLPAPWRLNAQTATFTRGAGSDIGFQVEPARVAR
ncbi:hypothetical protein LRS13_13640 [Svornostia abyssi]|uniref:Uncharacterized protein n=1 Tax=Svornostia abyssi TaxID=2898438 RepID=A0ABY5PAX7_9ACTN|nr:hypothetical protein LRS13_13640 [Parviterribacteraceae bacterium J379]